MTFTKWEIYKKPNVGLVENVYGVFELSRSMTDMSRMTYIGRGKLRDELWRYLNEPCTGSSLFFRYEQTSSDERAQERERALLREFKEKYGSLPECNERIG